MFYRNDACFSFYAPSKRRDETRRRFGAKQRNPTQHPTTGRSCPRSQFFFRLLFFPACLPAGLWVCLFWLVVFTRQQIVGHWVSGARSDDVAPEACTETHSRNDGVAPRVHVSAMLALRNNPPPQPLAQVMSNYLRFLRALLGASDETVHDLRFRDPANAEQMRHVPPKARQLWEVRLGQGTQKRVGWRHETGLLWGQGDVVAWHLPRSLGDEGVPTDAPMHYSRSLALAQGTVPAAAGPRGRVPVVSAPRGNVIPFHFLTIWRCFKARRHAPRPDMMGSLT